MYNTTALPSLLYFFVERFVVACLIGRHEVRNFINFQRHHFARNCVFG